jgi:hypothetical protein
MPKKVPAILQSPAAVSAAKKMSSLGAKPAKPVAKVVAKKGASRGPSR